jgi:hypothetical protein
MSSTLINQEELYQTNDVIHGFGEVPGVHTENGIGWVLPGRSVTYCRDTALAYAKRLDRLIQANVPRYNRNLVW